MSDHDRAHDQYKRHLFSEKPLYRTKLVTESEVDFGPNDRWQCTSPGEVVEPVREFLGDSPVEQFIVLLLATNNTIIGMNVASKGGLSSSVVEPRIVFRPALLSNAAAVICAHNHPSGNPEPSKEDVRITRQLVEAGEALGIPMHDHLIVTSTDWTSLAERGVIQ